MQFELELTLSGKRSNYAVSFEWPANFQEARILDETLSVNRQAIFTRHLAQTQLEGIAPFGIDWHVVALPVINERPGERAIQDIKSFFASMILIAPIPANMTGFSEEPSMELHDDAANDAACLRALLGQKPAAYGQFDSYVKAVIPDFSSIENVERGESGTQLIVKFEQQNPQRSLSVELIPEDDADRQIADGFVFHHEVDDRRIKVMPLARGWRNVLKIFEDEYIRHCGVSWTLTL